ncbi:hypothetical protein EV360DRAFT_90165 [Lentinula raphanica]|nr:hypothetical protein EV360DRAFT_90165 [Lentinula raphanica]
MGKHQVPCPRSKTVIKKSIRALMFPADGLTSEKISVFYREDPVRLKGQRYVDADEELTGDTIDSKVHDLIVSITHRRKKYKFRVFFRRHDDLPVNQSILNWANEDMEGDVLVVACGKVVDVRNMRGRLEEKVAKIAVRRLAHRLAPTLRTADDFPPSISVE